MKKALVALVLLALVGAGAGYYWWTRSETASLAGYRLAKVERGPLAAAVSSTGTLRAVVQVQVGSQISGQIKELHADFNTAVKKGQTIARLDPEAFELRVRQAMADVEAARATVLTQMAAIGAQRAGVSREEVNLAEAQRDYERKQMLVEKKFISSAERDKALSVFEVGREQVKTARAQLAVGEAQVKNAEALVKQREAQLAQARVDLDRTYIRSPVDGVVIKRSVDAGQTVAASLQAPELFVIAQNLADMQVEASIDEADVGRIDEGQGATFTVDSFPGRTFAGKVTQVRSAAQTVQNVVTYTVVIATSNPDLQLLPGMTANVRIVTDRRENVVKVPNAALRFRPPASAVVMGAPAGASGSAAPAAGGGAAKGQALQKRLIGELELNADQQSKLESILAAQKGRMPGMGELPPAERAKAAQRARAELRDRMAEILSAEQKARLPAAMGEPGAAAQGGTRGRVHMPGENRALRAVDVRLGVSDGTMTEVLAGPLKEGDEVIIGAGAGARAAKAPGPGPIF
ncbi:MAG: hypothetical protein A3I01_00425 [Betaproteobacteria bacterium RIFCSPLOWO2_02_FULL_65_24]|nr:MAG: hypothetical protein A3I01_00425 [Betaproteobacteria bacterium RIFCSPLOWO2_02_FULL_65_24]